MALFIDKTEKELFNSSNMRKTQNNLKKEEKLVLNEVESSEEKNIRVYDKGSRLVVLNTNNYVEKVGQKINKISFDQLNSDPGIEFKQKVIE